MDKFISFEGGEGSGKSTQIKLLSDKLRQAFGETQIVQTREPGGTVFSDQIRALLVEASEISLTPETQTLLLYAARSEHLEKIIRPSLLSGKWVLTDRFSDSTFAYQGYGLGVSFDFLKQLEAAIVQDTKPAVTFFLDIDPELGLRRAFSRRDTETKYESLGLAFHQKIYAGFQEMIADAPDRFEVINADQPVEEIAGQIWEIVSKKFKVRVDDK